MTDRLDIAKYHGTGNDFVFFEDLDDERPLEPALVAALCDRHTGVGADGVIRVVRGTDGTDFFMDYRNADGSLAEMCGNGVRCLGKLVFERGFTDRTELEVGTRGGVKHLSLDVRGGSVATVTVGMSAPAFRRSEIPMAGPGGETFLSEPFELGDGRTLKATRYRWGTHIWSCSSTTIPTRSPSATSVRVWNGTSGSRSTRTWSSCSCAATG